MGFFSGLVHTFTQPITRALGPVGTVLLAPALITTQVTGSLADKILGGIGGPHGSAPTQYKAMTPVPVAQPPRPAAPVYGQTGYQTPTPYYGGGGYYDYPQAPPQPFYGGSPWDFSMISPAYSPTPLPTYSAPQDRTWEDLVSLAPLAATFL